MTKPRRLVEMVRAQGKRDRVFKAVQQYAKRYHLAQDEDTRIRMCMRVSHFLTDHVKDKRLYDHYTKAYLASIHNYQKHNQQDDTFREYLT